MPIERGTVHVSRTRALTYPIAHESIGQHLEFVSQPPAFFTPLTYKERQDFITIVSDETQPLGGGLGVPSLLKPIVDRMISIGKHLNPTYTLWDISRVWQLLDHDNVVTNKPHSDSYLRLRGVNEAPRDETPVIRITVAGTSDNSTSGTIFYPGTYHSSGREQWVFDTMEQAADKKVVITPEFTIVGFNETDVHSSPIFKGKRRGILSVYLSPRII